MRHNEEPSGAGRLSIQLISSPTGCPKCAKCEVLVLRLMTAHPGRIDYAKVLSDSPDAEGFGVVMPPMLIVDGVILCAGRVPSEAKLAAFVDARLLR